MTHSAELRVTLWFDPFDGLRALSLSKGRLTTPRRIEGRKIEG